MKRRKEKTPAPSRVFFKVPIIHLIPIRLHPQVSNLVGDYRKGH